MQDLRDLDERIEQCEKAERAAGDLDFALRQPAGEVPRLLAARAAVLARRGQHADAAATADRLAALEPGSAGHFYDAACGYSLCAGAVGAGNWALREKYAARAVELLRQAVRAGFKDVAHVKRDSDLEPLRQRRDFQKLVQELEAGKP